MNFTNTEPSRSLKRTALGILLPAALILTVPAFAAEPAAKKPAARAGGRAAASGRPVGKRSRRVRAISPAAKDAAAETLLDAAEERLQSLLSIHESLGLRVSTSTLKKALVMNDTVRTAAAARFGRLTAHERPTAYRELLTGAIHSVRTLKGLRKGLEPPLSAAAMLAVRDLNAAIASDLAERGGLIPAAPDTGAGAPSEAGEDLKNETETLVAIAEVTFALAAFRKAEGRYPRELADLIPAYIPAVPAISIAGHPATREVSVVDSADHDSDLSSVMKDTGAWVYFSNKRSKYHGRVFVDCTHKNAQGAEFYRIGAGK